MTQDRYDALNVFVAESGVSPCAGEGLYARRPIAAGKLVCLFNGVRVRDVVKTQLQRLLYDSTKATSENRFGGV